MQESTSSISQFSALTLRRAFKSSRSNNNSLAFKKNYYHGRSELPVKAAKQQQHNDSRGNSSSSASSSSQATSSPLSNPQIDPAEISLSVESSAASWSSESLESLSTPMPHRRTRRRVLICDCCCCLNKCALSQTSIIRSATRNAEIRTGHANNHCPQNNHSNMIASSSGAIQQLGRSGAGWSVAARQQQQRRRRWQKTTTPRMPIPVPPPIVPLHKQLACELVVSGNNNSRLDDEYENSSPLTRGLELRSNIGREVSHRTSTKAHSSSRAIKVCASNVVAAIATASKVTAGIGCGMPANAVSRTDPGMVTDYECNWIELSRHRRRHVSSTNPASSSGSESFGGCCLESHNILDRDAVSGGKLLVGCDSGQNYFSPATTLATHCIDLAEPLGPNREATAILNDGMNDFLGDGGDSRKTTGIRINGDDEDICMGTIARRKCAPGEMTDMGMGFFPDISNSVNDDNQRIIYSMKEYSSSRRINTLTESSNSSNAEATIVDIKMLCENYASTTQTPPQATVNKRAEHEELMSTNPRKQGERISSSSTAIYDLPESGGALEFVRVEVSDGKRTITSGRLPLRPARRPAMPPPPPPLLAPVPQRRQLHQRKESASTNSGCVVANFSATNLAPDYAAGASAPRYEISRSTIVAVETATNRQSKRKTTNFPEESQKISSREPVDTTSSLDSTRQSNLLVKATSQQQSNHIKKKLELNSKHNRICASSKALVRFGLLDTIKETQPTEEGLKSVTSTDNESSRRSNGAAQTPGGQVRCKEELADQREISSVYNFTTQESNSGFEQSNKDSNMGTSQSNQATTAVQETVRSCNRPQTSSRSIEPRRSHRGKKSSSSGSSSSVNKTSSTNTKGQPSNETVAPPLIVEKISNMTHKLVGETKVMTSVAGGKLSRDHPDTGAPIELGSNGKQHVQSTLQMCIKGVVHKPVAAYRNHQAPANRRSPQQQQQPPQYGRLLERPRNGLEDSLERRRKSLQDGDVFIYPRVYKDLNECRKCLRDNRICDCNGESIESDYSPSDASVSTAALFDDKKLVLGSSTIIKADIHEVSDSDARQLANVLQPSLRTDQCATAGSGHKINREQQGPKASAKINTGYNPQTITTASDKNNNYLDAAEPPTTDKGKASQLESCPVSSGDISCGNESESSSENAAAQEPTSGSGGGAFSLEPPKNSCQTSTAASTQRSNMAVGRTPNESSSVIVVNQRQERCDTNELTTRQSMSPAETTTSPSPESIANIAAWCPSTSCGSLVSDSSSSSNRKFRQESKKVTTISICGASTPIRNSASNGSISSASSATTTATTASHEKEHSSIISIQTRRRNLAATKLDYARDDNKEEEEEDNKISSSLVPLLNATHGIVEATDGREELLSKQRISLLSSEPVTFRDTLSPICPGSGGGKDSAANAVLEYSPILSSVRDYIKNMNTELQVQTSMAAASPLRASDSPCPIAAADLVVATTAGCNGAAALTTGGAGKTALALESPIRVVTSTAGIVQATFTTALPAASIKAHVQTASSCVSVTTDGAVVSGDVGGQSPKKSIFEGASKDEILEYLEDARERVPEILMAADDVMVISENELIVVNQLEPDSPATPISIVETGEVSSIGSASDTLNCSPLPGSIGVPITHPDQLRQHLEQMYQTSQLAAASIAAAAATSEESKADSSATTSSDLQAGSGKSQQIEKLVGDRCEEINTAVVSQQCSGPIVGLLNLASPIYVGRRNSASESFIPTSASNNRENAMHILALQKRYQQTNNRNSLSSPSSSPPSSASPSSSSSASNQTSGNCSAATSFYASSSLSCSSPLLNLNGSTFSSSNSPAFNQSVPQPAAIKQLQPTIGNSGYSCSPMTNIAPQKDNLPHLTLQNKLKLIDTGQSVSSTRATPDSASDLVLMSPDAKMQISRASELHHVDRDDSGIGNESAVASANRYRSMTICGGDATSGGNCGKLELNTRSSSETSHLNHSNAQQLVPSSVKLSRIDETMAIKTSTDTTEPTTTKTISNNNSNRGLIMKSTTSSSARFSSQPNGVGNNGAGMSASRGHYNTLSRLNNYFMNRHPLSSSSDSTVEFQCLDCDQFIDVDQATIMNKTNELRLLRATDSKGRLDCLHSLAGGAISGSDCREMTPEQLDRAYVAAMNGLPLCKTCEKKRIERKEIISEFVETELKYGRDLKIIHDEFYRPMQIAGLLTKEQISGVFLNLEELIMAHCKFADRLETAIREAHSIGDTDFNTVNIGGLFLESAEMLNTFESYCIRQGAAACLLARLAKERELLRIFLRVSQMENTLLRRMNLAAFLMVPVQRVTKYPLLLNRLYKVTAYHHKDRESLRDAQLKVELHLEHINQQTKGIGASNKIWRRISSLSAPISNRRGLMNAEDIGYIKLRKTALDMLKWDRDEAQFIHSGKIHFAPLTEYLTRQKMKPLRYMPAHAMLIVLGRPNWKYRPDLVKANLDSKLMTPTLGGNGIREAALMLFREKNGRFVPCREPLLLSNCVFSADCSQFNNECPANQPNMMRQNNPTQQQHPQVITMNSSPQQQQHNHNGSTGSRKSAGSSCSSNSEIITSTTTVATDAISHVKHGDMLRHSGGSQTGSIDSATTQRSMSPREHGDSRAGSLGGDIALISSLRNLMDDASGAPQVATSDSSPPVIGGAAAHGSRSFSLASALPRSTLTTTNSTLNLSKPILSTATPNLTILNQLMTKVNSYHNRQSSSTAAALVKAASATPPAQSTISAADSQHQQQADFEHKSISPCVSVDTNNVATSAASSSSATVIDQMSACGNAPRSITVVANNSPSGSSSNGSLSGRASCADTTGQPNYTSYHYFHYNHHQPYGDYEESFELHERTGKESVLLRADTPLKTRYWLQMLRYHAKDLGQWRSRRNGLPNIMMMRHE